MSQTCNWGRLYTQGRCKAIGVPWTDEEAHAVFILKIPADYVRQGCLTQEDYEKQATKDHATIERTQKIPLTQLKRSQLAKLCEVREMTFTDEATRPTLIELLLRAGVAKNIPVSDVPLAEAGED